VEQVDERSCLIVQALVLSRVVAMDVRFAHASTFVLRPTGDAKIVGLPKNRGSVVMLPVSVCASSQAFQALTPCG
jgi:hypothetical protein